MYNLDKSNIKTKVYATKYISLAGKFTTELLNPVKKIYKIIIKVTKRVYFLSPLLKWSSTWNMKYFGGRVMSKSRPQTGQICCLCCISRCFIISSVEDMNTPTSWSQIGHGIAYKISSSSLKIKLISEFLSRLKKHWKKKSKFLHSTGTVIVNSNIIKWVTSAKFERKWPIAIYLYLWTIEKI